MGPGALGQHGRSDLSAQLQEQNIQAKQGPCLLHPTLLLLRGQMDRFPRVRSQLGPRPKSIRQVLIGWAPPADQVL